MTRVAAHPLQPECDELIHEARNVNYIDEAEYPSSTQIQNKCVCHVLIRVRELWHHVNAAHQSLLASLSWWESSTL
jgi:hypothetical protein